MDAGFNKKYIHRPLGNFCFYAQQTTLNVCPVLTKANKKWLIAIATT